MDHPFDNAYLALQFHAFRETYFSAFSGAVHPRNQELKSSYERPAAVMVDKHAGVEEQDRWRREIEKNLETAKEFAEILSREMQELREDVEAIREMLGAVYPNPGVADPCHMAICAPRNISSPYDEYQHLPYIAYSNTAEPLRNRTRLDSLVRTGNLTGIFAGLEQSHKYIKNMKSEAAANGSLAGKYLPMVDAVIKGLAGGAMEEAKRRLRKHLELKGAEEYVLDIFGVEEMEKVEDSLMGMFGFGRKAGGGDIYIEGF